MSRQEVRHNLCLRMSVQHVIKNILSFQPFTLTWNTYRMCVSLFLVPEDALHLHGCMVSLYLRKGEEGIKADRKLVLYLFSLSLSLKINPEIN